MNHLVEHKLCCPSLTEKRWRLLLDFVEELWTISRTGLASTICGLLDWIFKHFLGRVSRRLVPDWKVLVGFQPVLIEAFGEERFPELPRSQLAGVKRDTRAGTYRSQASKPGAHQNGRDISPSQKHPATISEQQMSPPWLMSSQDRQALKGRLRERRLLDKD